MTEHWPNARVMTYASLNSMKLTVTLSMWRKWSVILSLILICRLANATNRDSYAAGTSDLEFYEEVIEDRYNLMDINDEIYASLPSESTSSSVYR